MQTSLIKITHIINPSRFYCRDLSLAEEEHEQIKKIEEKLKLSAKRQNEILKNYFEPKPNDLLAYHIDNTKKWIRCEVDDIIEFNGVKTYFLWAMDYGIPLHTSDKYKFFPLHESAYRLPLSMIFVAGLDVMPATIRFDYMESRTEKVFVDKWSPRAVELFRSSIAAAPEIHFVPSKTVSHFEVRIGDLHIGENSRLDYALGWKMVKFNTAINVPADEFLKRYKELFTNRIERWNDNMRAGGVLKNAEGIVDPEMLNLGVEEDESDLLSIADEKEQKFIIQKVNEWQSRNEDISGAEGFEEGSFIYQDDARANSVTNGKELPTKLTVDAVAAMTAQLSMENRKAQSKQPNRRVISLPAGAMLTTTVMKPDYVSRVSRVSTSLHQDIGADADSNYYDQFVSVSQVGVPKLACESDDESE